MVRRVGFFGNLGDPREAGNVEAGWSGRWVAGCVLGYPGVVTWVNGECPWSDNRRSGRRGYVCIKMRTQVNTPLFTAVHTPPHTCGRHPRAGVDSIPVNRTKLSCCPRTPAGSTEATVRSLADGCEVSP